MEIIKLNQKYVLGRAGFKHAIFLTRDNDPYMTYESKIIRILNEKYGNGYYIYNVTGKKYHVNKCDITEYEWGKYRNPNRDSFIGFKNESTLTALMLLM